MASTLKIAEPRQRSSWIPWAFVGAFAVVLAFNIVLVVEASRSWTGVVSETPFDTGNDYNRIMAEAQHEASLGWKVDASASRTSDDTVRIVVTVEAAPGRDAAADVDGTMLRPIGMHAPVPLAFRPLGAGRYEAIMKLREVGNWDLRLLIRGKDGEIHTTRRLFLS